MKRASMVAVATMLVAGFAACGGNVPAGFVDLSLPSGLLWAECNLGATMPEGYGNYYAWGETAPKCDYIGETYRYANDGNYDALTKYCNYPKLGYNGFTDSLTVLQSMDDAATQALGECVRTPTKEEWQELLDNTTQRWVMRDDAEGLLLTAANGNSLFLPAAGGRDTSLDGAGTLGHYWSSSLFTGCYPGSAWYFSFDSGGQYMGHDYRYYGFSVRPVRSAR